MSTSELPALIYLLWPKNLRVLQNYLKRHGPRVVLTLSQYYSEAMERVASEHKSQIRVIDNLLSVDTLLQIQQREPALQSQLTERLSKMDDGSSDRLAQHLAQSARASLLDEMKTIFALDEMAAEHPVELTILNEDWMPIAKAVWLGHRKRIPTLHLYHNPGAMIPATCPRRSELRHHRTRQRSRRWNPE